MSTIDPQPPEDSGRPATGGARREPATEPAPTRRRASGFDDEGHLKHSRSGALYIGLIVAAVLAIVVLVFILQNSESTSIRFFGFEGSFPTGVAVLLAAVVGMLIVAVPGSVRIIQLRRALAKNEKRTRHDA